MELLIDTHVFLSMFGDRSRLSKRVLRILYDTDNRLHLSLVSAWEIMIKAGKGRLELPEPPQSYLVNRLESEAIECMPIQLSHILRVTALPALHHDPFDRLLIAQSLAENLPLVTSDGIFARYGVKTIW